MAEKLLPQGYVNLLIRFMGFGKFFGNNGLKYIQDDEVAAPVLAKERPPPSHFHARIHPLVDQVSAEVDGYFLEHWPFTTEQQRKKFRAAGFSRVTCLYYPAALDDRIHFACRLLTVLFLIDDLLEDMSFEDGSAYNEKLIPISRGDVLPDRNIPVEYITYDLWESMRQCDKTLADSILEPVFTFMRAQTDKKRLEITGLGEYLEYRERDVGKALLSALMRFAMKLNLTEAELEIAIPVEQNCSKHISVLNDIYSWEKELEASQSGHEEGSAVCSSVQVMKDEANLGYGASKRVLWAMCREWEVVHKKLVWERTPCSKDLEKYMKGLEYQISGNERWSESTPRYHC
ncbi:MAG: carbonyl reductase (NADPH-dependent) ari1 [Sclerophora amabilis]|nr:MAG: carbonyl reductase (NADPH-dependent) ari1 [Sclerophora amabilis]